MSWKITHKPDPEFDGYPWHGPAGTEPTQYRIDLKPEHLDPNAPVWVMWPSGEVYIQWGSEPVQIGEAREMEYDNEPHSWMFDGLGWAKQSYLIRTEKSKELLTYFHLIRDEIDTIITDSVHDWPKEDDVKICQNCNIFQTGDILEGTPCETCTRLHEDSRPDPDIERTLNWVPKETGETCVWCEHDTAEEIEAETGDPNYDPEAYTNWTKYQCSTCGAEFVLGSKTIDFSDITKKGKPELSVECACFNCKWNEESPIIGMDGIGCAGCYTEPNGQLTHNDPTAKSNWELMGT